MSREPKAINPILIDFLKALLIPTLIGKAFVYYFGLRYSEYPGEGWGYALTLAIAITVGNLLRFVWKYRDVQDP